MSYICKEMENLRIGYDAKRAMSNFTGLGNYSRLVLESYARRFPSDSLLGFAPRLNGVNPRLEGIRGCTNVAFTTPQGIWRHMRSAWRSAGIAADIRKSGVDLFHGLSNELPLNIRSCGIPSIVTIHDVIYRRMPECYTHIDRRLYDLKYGASCRNATRIVAISECTARDIAEIYGIDPGKIEVIYQGCDDNFRRHITEAEINATLAEYRLPERYILQVGTVERRKNLELTVRALAALPEDIKLVAAGRATSYLDEVIYPLLDKLSLRGRFIHLPSVPFTKLPALDRGAAVIAYPSRYEGFGLPVIEGLASRRPVVAATGSCLEEAGGDAAIYVSPDDPRRLAEAIRHILESPEDAAGMTARGAEYEKKFDNTQIPLRLRDLYLSLIHEHKKSLHDAGRK